MSKIDLSSREWCDLVFEGRNQAYGAYVLRRDEGKRYRKVALLLGSIVLVALMALAAVGYVVYRKVSDQLTQIEREFTQLKPKKEDDGYQTKRLSRGRRASRGTTPNATETAPTVGDDFRRSLSFGIAGPDDSEVEFDERLEDLDLDHNATKEELPVEGPQLVETDKVEEMPLFPGGVTAFRQYLDAEVSYSLSARRRKIQGEIIVSFVIEADGSVADVRLDQKLDLSLDRSVLTAIARMPRWQPGKQDGRPIPVRISIPVRFELD